MNIGRSGNINTLWLAWFGIAVGVFGSVISVVSAPAGIIVSLVGAIVAAHATYRQYVEGQPFVTYIAKESWTEHGQNDWTSPIPQTMHRKGLSPKVSVFLLEPDGTYRSAVEDYKVLPNGDIMVGGGLAFDKMKVVI